MKYKYELTNKGLITNDPIIAAMFLKMEIPLFDTEITCGILSREWSIHTDGGFTVPCSYDYNELDYFDNILISYEILWDRIQPVIGEGCVVDSDLWPDALNVITVDLYDKIYQEHQIIKCYHIRLLNITSIRSDIRKLVEKCEENR